MAGANDNQLRRMVNAIQVVADTVNSENPHIMITHFVGACRLFVTRDLGFRPVFDIVDTEIANRVRAVENDVNIDDTVESILERDLNNHPEVDNLSRCILRLMRVIETLTITFEQTLANPETDSLQEAVSEAHRRVWAPISGPLGRQFFESLIPFVPTLSHVVETLNENAMNEVSRNYVEASRVVINYIVNLFRANEVSDTFLRLI